MAGPILRMKAREVEALLRKYDFQLRSHVETCFYPAIAVSLKLRCSIDQTRSTRSFQNMYPVSKFDPEAGIRA